MNVIKIFDLDGTLFNTKAAVIEAYRRAGIDANPYWGKPWQEWCAPDIHNHKNLIYDETLKSLGSYGWAWVDYFKACGSQYVGILTGASEAAVKTIQQCFKIKSLPIIGGFNLSTKDKNLILKSLSDLHITHSLIKQKILYYDDLPELGAEAVKGSKVELVTPSNFYRFRGL